MSSQKIYKFGLTKSEFVSVFERVLALDQFHLIGSKCKNPNSPFKWKPNGNVGVPRANSAYAMFVSFSNLNTREAAKQWTNMTIEQKMDWEIARTIDITFEMNDGTDTEEDKLRFAFANFSACVGNVMHPSDIAFDWINMSLDDKMKWLTLKLPPLTEVSSADDE